MFKIFIRTLDANEQVTNTAISGAFAERKEAVAQLDKMVKQLVKDDEHPDRNAGYHARQDYWWTRENGVVTHYTIEA